MKTLIILGSASLLFLSCAANSAAGFAANEVYTPTSAAGTSSGFIQKRVDKRVKNKLDALESMKKGDSKKLRRGRTVKKKGDDTATITGNRGTTIISYSNGKIDSAEYVSKTAKSSKSKAKKK